MLHYSVWLDGIRTLWSLVVYVVLSMGALHVHPIPSSDSIKLTNNARFVHSEVTRFVGGGWRRPLLLALGVVLFLLLFPGALHGDIGWECYRL